MVEHAYAVIMAGGKGERFWPLSSKTVPKPFLPLFGKRTMIQETVDRITPVIPRERVLIVLAHDHLPVAQAQLPEIPADNFIVEPMGRDTAACIGLASLYIAQRDPHASMVVLAADHSITGREAFAATIASCLTFLTTHDYIITIGIKPTRPETGYGYIALGDEITGATPQVFYRVLRFTEKPDPVQAARYLSADNYCWNSGIFAWKNSTIQESIAAYMPVLWEGLMRINSSLGSREEAVVMKREFSHFERISIDYGVLEQSPAVAVVPASFGWDDIGTWAAFERVSSLDESRNVRMGRHVGKDTSGCIIYSQDQLVATLRVRDLVIVQAEGKLLVCHKEQAPFLKEIVAMVEEEGA
jgi:mannose-1-phosphate guanylyltransferase